jgi:hypothetical protein
VRRPTDGLLRQLLSAADMPPRGVWSEMGQGTLMSLVKR